VYELKASCTAAYGLIHYTSRLRSHTQVAYMYPHLDRRLPFSLSISLSLSFFLSLSLSLKVPRISRDARREGEAQPPEGEDEWGSRGRTRGGHAEGEGAVRGSLPQPPEGGGGGGSRSEEEEGYTGIYSA
jgi:hypothetical protein